MRLRRDFRVLLPLVLFLVTAVVPRAFADCGNGLVEAGEDCDDGAQNGTTNSCCDASCKFNGNSPDVVVGDLVGTTRWGTVHGISAYSVGTTSCNYGSCWLNWIASTAEHPVIGQNMFRLENGRFEQVGQSWLKHGFSAQHDNACFNDCVFPPNGAHLGVHCSDPYSNDLNGQQTSLGPKDDVNADTGVYPFPDSRESTTGDAIFKRLQIHDTDINPAMNAGALYFVEGQYVSHDDATAKNNTNNASYRPCTFSGTTTFTLTLTGSTVRQKAGIQAWKAQDPTVTEVIVDADQGRFILSAKATSLGGGLWHYEYALQNLTNQRAGQSFTVPIPAGTTVTNVGFHDVDYHSGTPYEGTDWAPTIGATSVSWQMATATNPANSNALRWGTLYNFRFDANVPPGGADITIGLWRPGFLPTATAHTVVPNPCLSAPNGTACDDLNACTQGEMCSAGVCGGGAPFVCTPIDQCHFPGSCNPTDGRCSTPNRPDGTPCNDTNACTQSDTCGGGVCLGGAPVTCSAIDFCHDAGTCNSLTGACSTPAKPDGTPCDDANACTFSDQCTGGTCAGTGPLLPDDVGNGVTLSQANGVTTISWTPAANSASSSVLRGSVAQLPVGPGGGDEVCLDTGDTGSSTVDPQDPPVDGGFWYLVRGVNACGVGTYGSEEDAGTQGPARQSATCP